MRNTLVKFAIAATCLASSIVCGAEQRHIHVNSEHLSEDQIARLDYLADGRVESAFYWIDFESGPWCGQQGVAGYWVWANPAWYIWENSSRTAKGSGKTTIYNYDGGGSFVSGEECSYVSVGGTSMRVCD